MTERLDPAALVRDVDPRWDAARIERALDVQLRVQRRRRVRTVALGAAAAAALVLVVQQSWPDTSVPVAETVAPAAPASSEVLSLADGSTFTAAPGSTVSLLETGPTRVRAALVEGSVEVDVVPNPDRELRVEVGAVTVIVLGTAFRVTREEAAVEVAVHRGRVRVEHPAEAGLAHTELGVGETGRFALVPPVTTAPDTETTAEAEAPSGRDRVRAPETERPSAPTEASTEAATEAPTALVTARDWRRLAEEGDYDEAYEAMSSAGAPSAASLEELLLAADAARLSGHPREALPYLERAEHAATGDPRAPLAAFSSGRLLRQLGRHAEAADAFERVLALEPHGSLAEDALVRAAEERDRADDHAAAQALARRYLAEHEDGRSAPRMRALLP